MPPPECGRRISGGTACILCRLLILFPFIFQHYSGLCPLVLEVKGNAAHTAGPLSPSTGRTTLKCRHNTACCRPVAGRDGPVARVFFNGPMGH